MAEVELRSFILNENYDMWTPWNRDNELNIAVTAFDGNGQPFPNASAKAVHLFRGIKPGKLVNLPNGFFTLDIPTDAEFRLGINVIENDADSRQAATVIDEILENPLVKAGIVAAFAAPPAVAVPVMSGILKLISIGLGKNTDDEVCVIKTDFMQNTPDLSISSAEQHHGNPVFTATFCVTGVQAE